MSNYNYSSDSNHSALCDTAKLILNNNKLFVTHIFECILALFALIFNISAIYMLWRVKVFHSNLRLLLANLSLVLALYPTGIAVKALRFLLTPVCQLPVQLKWCIIQDWVILIPSHNSLISLVTLCLERLYATVRYRTYDFAKAPPYLAIVLLTASWSVTLGIHLPRIKSIAARDTWIPVCQWSLSLGSKEVVPTLVAFAVIEALALILTISVYLYNRYLLNKMAINRAKFDLSSRFQVDQNLKLSSALLPSDLLHVMFYLISYLSLIITIYMKWLPIGTKMWLVQLTYLYRMIYASAHPILLMFRNPSMRRGVAGTEIGQCFTRMIVRLKTFLKGEVIGDISGGTSNVMDVYFNQLERNWSAAHHKQNE